MLRIVVAAAGSLAVLRLADGMLPASWHASREASQTIARLAVSGVIMLFSYAVLLWILRLGTVAQHILGARNGKGPHAEESV